LCGGGGGVHCDIYESSYNVSNISYLNSPPPSFSFISPFPFLEWFQQESFLHLHTCVYIFYTIFTLLASFPATSPLLLVPVVPWVEPVLPSCSLILLKKKEKKKEMKFFVWLKVATQGVSMYICYDISMYIYFITRIGLSPLIFFILP
jgi:hypothetical protein